MTFKNKDAKLLRISKVSTIALYTRFSLQLPTIVNKIRIAYAEPLFKKLCIQVLKFYFNYCHNNVTIYFESFACVSRSKLIIMI